jgi:phosphoglycolate phosphatase-like HAD superfamily hydrolase
MTKGIIFDFDGVICDSVNVKTEAFALMYRKYGDEVVSRVIQFHHDNGGISRHEKFRYFHKEFLGISLTDEEVIKMSDDFSSIVLQRIINSPYLPGVMEFIQRKSFNSMLFICTGTPETEIKIILEAKKINKYFKSVYGSPKTKTVIIQEIMKSYNLLNTQLEFYGDATTDYNAALENDIKFIGVLSKTTEFPDGTIVINDFTSI